MENLLIGGVMLATSLAAFRLYHRDSATGDQSGRYDGDIGSRTV